MKISTASVAVIALASAANAGILRFDVQNNQAAGGLGFTPVWFGLHNGSFDLFESGESVTAGLQTLAETGSPAALDAEFAAPGRLSTIVAEPTGGTPVFVAGGTGNFGDLTTINPAAYRYLTFATMIVPSNDLFVGNNDPFAIELFDAAGNFNGTQVIEVTVADIYDAGTEVNVANDDGAFLPGATGTRTDENGVASRFFGFGDSAAYLASLEGLGVPEGSPVANTGQLTRDTVLLTITVREVPAPGAAGLAAVAGLAATRRRRG